MNALIIDKFNELINQIDAEYLNAVLDYNIKEIDLHDVRLKQVKKILSIIRMIGFEITSENDLRGIPGIGEGTLKRIKEILETGELSELKRKYDPVKQKKINGFRELLKVIGIGNKSARRLVTEYGITTVDKLKDAVDKGKVRVGYQVKLGLKYYDLLQKKIPRSEIQLIEKYLVEKAHQIDPNLHVIICGSYRRGLPTSGDIDVMIYHPKVKFVRQIYRLEEYGLESYLELLVDLLTKEGFLLDRLSFNKMKYMGFCKYNINQMRGRNTSYKTYPVRRIDIIFMPYYSLPSAMLYFTGPAQLNEDMRRTAKSKNMTLNEYGLFILDSRQNYIPVPIRSEKDIFEELGMPYLTPQEREKYNTGKH